jgi:hypothetical protein
VHADQIVTVGKMQLALVGFRPRGGAHGAVLMVCLHLDLVCAGGAGYAIHYSSDLTSLASRFLMSPFAVSAEREHPAAGQQACSHPTRILIRIIRL